MKFRRDGILNDREWCEGGQGVFITFGAAKSTPSNKHNLYFFYHGIYVYRGIRPRTVTEHKGVYIFLGPITNNRDMASEAEWSVVCRYSTVTTRILRYHAIFSIAVSGWGVS
jgi:hypothetical protein